MHSTNCLNCNKPFTERELFCSSCGQRTTTHRFSLKSIFAHDFVHAIFHLDRGFFSTLKNLFLQPGTVVKEFLDGKRVKYFNYFTMILILITVGHLLSLKSPIKLAELMNTKANANKTIKTPFKVDTALLIGKNVVLDSQELSILNQKIDSIKRRREIAIKIEARSAKTIEEFLASFERFTKESPKLFFLFLLPIYTLFSFVWFHKSKLNFSEHLILNIYKTCGDMVFGILLTLGFYVYPKVSFWIVIYPFTTLLIIAYGTWFFHNFFKRYYKDSGIVFLKSLAAIITVQLVIGLSAGVYIIIKMIQLSS
jgi:hypothetical protein